MIGLSVLLGFLIGSADAGGALAAGCAACISTWCPSAAGYCWMAPPPGPGYALCLVAFCGVPCGAVCAGTAATCFSGDTEFNTTNGTKVISDLKVGDKVATQSRHTLAYTEVVELQYLREASPMFTLSARYPALSLTTTASHLHFARMSGEYGDMIPKHAASIGVGMQLAQVDGRDFTVTSKTKSMQPGRWVLMTDTCTAYANGVLTSTFCSDARKAATHSFLSVEALKYVDENGDGMIDVSEVQARLRSSTVYSGASSDGDVRGPPELKRVHVDFDKDGEFDRGELEINSDADGVSDFQQADKDGDGVIDLTPEGKDGFKRNFTEEMFAEIMKAKGMPFGMQPKTSAEQKILFAWLKDSYDTSVAQCDADNNHKITRSEFKLCGGNKDYWSQPATRPQQLAAADLQEAHLTRMAEYVMSLFDIDGNKVLDGNEIGIEMGRAANSNSREDL